ncbi:vacuolar aspartyl aminopeptidase Lap4 [Lecanosticta acicola]|uniref:Vacuolar aspartyl aminopeptidase Lap4 n=1 Tax=Lecanosticta acicola TaxID=111012 RepID=A0AAI9EF43_9PEZI|nr:vacuolar aspartyl aminopeptidase Lap4 [Lecanosticta acicola]
MVRNSASMHSLRSSMADCSISSEERQQQPELHQAEEQSPLKRLGGPSMQLCGQDAATKALMTKVATGQATEDEQAAFNMHINQARSSPSIRSMIQPKIPNASSHDASSNARLPYDPTSVVRRSDHSLDEAAQESERALAELLYKKDQLDNAIKSTQARMQHPSTKETPKMATKLKKEDIPPLALQDIQMQLALLRQHAKKRLQPPHNRQEPALRYVDEEHDFKQYLAQLEDRSEREAAEAANRFKQATRQNAAVYTKPFCDFLTENPTVFHAVSAMKQQLLDAGFTALSERDAWELERGGAYFVERNGSSLIAFVVGAGYEPGNGAAILAGHVDALTAKLKPISQVPNKAGYLQLGIAPYAGALNKTWWDRDLGVGGRVHVKEGDKIVTKLVKLDWPIAKIPTLAEHFGAAAQGPYNKETQMVPIIGLDSTNSFADSAYAPDGFSQPPLLGSAEGPVSSFIRTQPPALVKAISDALGLESTTGGASNIVNWELELFDVQPATVAGLNKELISAGRIDDKLCSWAALQALVESHEHDTSNSSLIKVVGLFDDEEIGSLLRQGAKGNFLPMTIERAVSSLAGKSSTELVGRTYANSFMVSSDVTHAVNPNFLNAYLENHAPHLNVGVAIAADSNGHMTTDSVSTSILKRCADKVGAQLQVFQIRNDSHSGGTVGPMLSSAMGVRAIDAGLAQLSMHSIRATTGALDPGLGVLTFLGFLNGFESVDKEFQDS